MKQRLCGLVAATLISLPAIANDGEPEILSVKTVEVYGDRIELLTIKDPKGRICSQFIETAQLVAYGKIAYTLGERCAMPTPNLDRT